MQEKTFKQNEVIFWEGSSGKCMYKVIQGTVCVFLGYGTKDETKLTELGEGRIFGEMAVLEAWTRSATVVAAHDEVKVLEISAEELSDFFAEIRFIRLNNLTYSSSDILKISGTLAKDGERGELKLHQIDWSGDNADISDNIYYYINGNEIFFFCTYTERFAGFAWDVESIASRAAYDSARYTKIAPTMISDPEALPKKAFNSMGMMIDNLL